MAEAAKKKQAKKTPKKNPVKEKTVRKGMSDTQRWVLGIVLFAFAMFLLVAVVSYYFTWQADQNFVRHGDMNRQEVGVVANQTGKTGASIAYYVVGQWFGVFGIVIPVLLIIIALRIIDFRPALLSKSVRIGIIGMILGSLTLGFLFDEKWNIFGTGLGGAHGIYISRWIVSYLGKAGTALVLLLGWILLGVYMTRRTILVVNRVGRGIYEGGRKVGEAVIGHASDLAARGGDVEEAFPDEEEYYGEGLQDAEPERIAPQPPVRRDEEIIEIVRPTGESLERERAKAAGAQAQDVGREFEIADNRRMAEQPHGVFTVVTPVREPEPEPEMPPHDPKVVVLGEAAGSFIRTGTHAAAQPVDDSRYAGGVGRYANAGESRVVEVVQKPQEQPMQPERKGPFEVVSKPGAPLAAGGVIESVPTGAGAPGQMEVVMAARKDVVLDDSDIENRMYDPTRELSKYQKPPVEILEDHSVEVNVTEEEVYANKNQIETTLLNFGIKIDKIKATIGPTVTLYEIIPAAGVKISKIKNLEDDIALSLKALGIRIIAPMPGKGTVGIEVPNKDKEIVSMYSVIKTKKFQESKAELPIVLGKTISNETFMIDLTQMPHLLVAGATGQGKSVGLNAIITSLLYKKHPAELKFVFVDPKRVELSLYSRLEKHFLAKMESEDEAILTDTSKVVYTLNSLCELMSRRYDLLRAAEVKKISEYNEKIRNRRLNPNKGHEFMPYVVVVVDEFADLIMTAGREIEAPLTRLAQLARAVGIHLVIATQRPDVKVITGLIKANFPARIAFRVMSMVDSRTIIDQPGANQLIGRGDMLMSLNGELTRVQCAFIDTPEIERITEFIGNQRGYAGAYDLPDYHPDAEGGGERQSDLGPTDPMFEDVARFVVQNQQGSTSSIQRRFAIGYNRAGRIMDQLEDAGIVGRAEGSKPREVLIMDMMSLEHILGNLDR